MFNKITNIALYLLVAAGLFGALSVSYSTLTDIAPCPAIFRIPVCYVVAMGYAAMALYLGLRLTNNKWPGLLFMSGWIVVFSIAAFATLLEITVANTCPTSGLGIPLCYASLVLSMVILFLFKRTPASNHAFYTNCN